MPTPPAASPPPTPPRQAGPPGAGRQGQAPPLALGRAGQIFEVKSKGRSALVTEQGAGLLSVNWDGTELLNHVNDDGYGGNGAHGQVLAPWPGRVSRGAYSYAGEEHRLPVDDQAHGAAIHGLARWLTWAPKHEAPGSLTMAARLLARPGYPFCFDLEQSYTWLAGRLEVSFRATNIGRCPAPFGYGCHPYFTVGLPSVDEGILSVPASEYLATDNDLNPLLPARPVDGTPYDFRQPRPVGDARLDVALGGFQRCGDAEVAVTFASPDGAVVITCHYGPEVRFVQLFSGDTLTVGRRQGLAIEPYTCAPNAFNNGLGLKEVGPGETLRVDWSVSAHLA